ncbi:neuronal acetylcholine receptor subunit alpha-7 [Plakobranchus ocellatus]|uniref:Neuronal acetylcholine receptor subunit alpha-7 n=1 Tax=Plakobranchus ocellatus TaxID=259542 RepID=A0AAV3YWG3_9GAST|nr:neuronal acetylcholine receptor subunit alpha-7 [Plakobranchus ocellatus]
MILPIVFLSLLNLLVFVIPVDSGEKISYGITVLLALSVFMSIMSGLLPMSSESMPLVISYIFSLMVISVLTVVNSVIIVRLHHMEEKEERSHRIRENFQSTLPKIKALQNCVHPLEHAVNALQEPKVQNTLSNGQAKIANTQEDETRRMSTSSLSPSEISKTAGRVNKYKLVGKHIDMISLVVFGTVWIGTTLGFMIAITT